MSEKNIIIRLETKERLQSRRKPRPASHSGMFIQPGCMEHYVLHCYRDDPAFVPDLDFVDGTGR